MTPSRRTPPHIATTRLTLAYRVLEDARPQYATAARWLALTSALAAWPGAPTSIERRLTTPARDALVAETIVVTVDGVGILGSAEELERDAEHLVRPLLADVRCARLAGLDALRDAGLTFEVRETARLDALPEPVMPTSGAAAEGLAAALGALADGCSHASISLSVATPSALGNEGAVRFGVVVTTDDAVPNAALAHLAAIVGAGPAAWRRSRAAAAAAGAAGAPGDALADPGSGQLVDRHAAAAAMLIPVRPAARHIDGAPSGVDGARRSRCVVLSGTAEDRAGVLRKVVAADLRRGRRVLWLDLVGPRSDAPSRPLPAADRVVADLRSGIGRAIHLPLAMSSAADAGVADVLEAILATEWLPGDAPSVFVDGGEDLLGEQLGGLLDRHPDSPVKLILGGGSVAATGPVG